MNPNDDDNRRGSGSGGPAKLQNQQTSNDSSNASSLAPRRNDSRDRAAVPGDSSSMSLFSLLFTGLDTMDVPTTALPMSLWPDDGASHTTGTTGTSLPHYAPPHAPPPSPFLSLEGLTEEDENDATNNSTMNVINQALALVDGIEESLPPIRATQTHPPLRSSQHSARRRVPCHRLGRHTTSDHQRPTANGDSESRQ